MRLVTENKQLYLDKQPIPVAAQSKARVCGHSLPGIVGSNPTGDMSVCLSVCLSVVSVVCCQVEVSASGCSHVQRSPTVGLQPLACWDYGFESRAETWMSVCSEWCVLSGRGLCVGLITHPDESYRVWCVWVWSWNLNNEEALAHWGLLR
jgi:hypothetical protein